MTSLVPIANLPALYANNGQLSWGSNTTLTAQIGQFRDSTDTFDMFTTAITTINGAINGLNGLDTGTLAANTFYYVYMIADASGFNATGWILSLSATVPQMPNGLNPSGYSVYRQVGVWLTDSSEHFLLGYVVGNSNLRSFWYDATISVLSAGTATSLTAVDLSPAVPPIQNTFVTLNAQYTPATAGDSVIFVPGDSTSTTGVPLSGSVAAVAQKAQVKVLARIISSKAEIKYINSASSGSTTALVQGFEMYI